MEEGKFREPAFYGASRTATNACTKALVAVREAPFATPRFGGFPLTVLFLKVISHPISTELMQ